jgi:hypothetical protein
MPGGSGPITELMIKKRNENYQTKQLHTIKFEGNKRYGKILCWI